FTQLENTNLHKDGRSIVLETSGVPIVDHDGNIMGYRGVDRDITERKLAGEALRKSEQKYRVLFEQSADATLIIDQDRFVDCNDAVVRMLRYGNKADLLTSFPRICILFSPNFFPDWSNWGTAADTVSAGRYGCCRRRSAPIVRTLQVAAMSTFPYRGDGFDTYEKRL
ncbi:MAG: PAS domain-containing protein, partial [Gemmatimonadales bacterium]|nr:PAS domain-containing protein [Gemmatimonadales bacterium]